MRKILIFLILVIMVLQSMQFNIRGEEYQTISSQVKMQERWLKVTVYYYAGNEKWARHVLDLSLKALPQIEIIAGFPYPHEYDVKVYEASMEEAGGWGGRYGGEEGIWVSIKGNETIGGCDDSCLIHEHAHAWTQLYKRQWMGEGYANFYAYLALEKLNKKSEADGLKNGLIQNFLNIVKTFDWYLGKDFYTYPKPSNWSKEDEKRKDFCYKKSFTFVYLMYKEFGLEALQEVNLAAHKKKSQYDTMDFKKGLEKVTNKSLDDFFLGWVLEGRYKVYSPKDFQDSDSDRLMNFEEKILGTNSNVADTDNDRIADGVEIKLGTDPKNPDTDGDGLNDGEEFGLIVDGLIGDWIGLPYMEINDPQGDCASEAKNNIGADIKTVWAIMDDNYLYLTLEVYGKFDPTLFRNYFIALDYDNDNKDEYHFGFRPNGTTWYFDHTKNKNDWNAIWTSDFEAFGGQSVIEVKIPKSKFKIPSKFKIYSRVTDGEINIDDTSWHSITDKNKFSYSPTNPLVPDLTQTQKQIFDKAKSIFDQAMKAFNSLDYQKAKDLFIQTKEKFKEINYQRKVKEAEEWIQKCEEELNRKKILEEIDALISKAKEEFQKQDFEKAKELFSQTESKYQELKDDEKVKEMEGWIKKCDEEINKKLQSPTPQPQEQKKTSIPVLTVICAILLIYIKKKAIK